jgi:peroxiredoxin
MSLTFFFAAGLILGAAPAETAVPKLEKGLEVRWTGQLNEASFRPGMRNIRDYEVDTRMFVLDADDFGSDLVLMTRITPKTTEKRHATPIVRIEMGRVDRKGKMVLMPSPEDEDNPSPKAKPWPSFQLQGLPMYETGMFMAGTEIKLLRGSIWKSDEAGRPQATWKVADTESFKGQLGLKIVREQLTEGFYGKVARQEEWRRMDHLTLIPTNGFASRWERVVEVREIGSPDLTYRSKLTMEQAGRLVYSGRFYQERREETTMAAAFESILERLLAEEGRSGTAPFESLARRIRQYQIDNAASDSLPYREAVVAIRKRSESAAQGNIPPVAAPTIVQASATVPAPVEQTSVLAIDKSIPDIELVRFDGGASTRLVKLQGKTVLLAYFQPSSPTTSDVIKLGQQLQLQHKSACAILPLAIGEKSAVKKLQESDEVALPLYDGAKVYKTHALEATPVFIIVDRNGIVRHVSRGWGSETAATIQREFERLAK